MRKFYIIILTFVFVIPFLFMNQPAQAKTIGVQLNGQALTFSQPPIFENNRVLVPMRGIFEAMGAQVSWDSKTSSVKANKGTLTITLPINNKQATVNGVKKDLDVPAKIVKGSTLVPLRFVGETLGANVEWDSNKYLVLITTSQDLSAGKTYPDGWTAPVLKSSWTTSIEKNYQILQNELGFKRVGGVYFSVPGQYKAIQVAQESSIWEVSMTWTGWTDPAVPASYRIPIVSKELFKFYFGKDYMKVYNYFNSNNIPEQFKANGRTVKVMFDDNSGVMYMKVGYPNKPF